jgi:hypothetical protein
MITILGVFANFGVFLTNHFFDPSLAAAQFAVFRTEKAHFSQKNGENTFETITSVPLCPYSNKGNIKDQNLPSFVLKAVKAYNKHPMLFTLGRK